MRAFVVVAATLSVLLACGSASKGPEAGRTYFWNLGTATQTWGQCSDDPEFRNIVVPIVTDGGQYFIYRVSQDGTEGISQRCTDLFAAACTDSDGGVVYDISGRDLTFSQTWYANISNANCAIQYVETWTLTDNNPSMHFSRDTVTSLVFVDAGSPQNSCDVFENYLTSNSPNGLGANGCAVTDTLDGTIAQ